MILGFYFQLTESVIIKPSEILPLCVQVVNKIMYTGSSDHTGRAWVTEFGENTRIYKGHKHTVSVIKVYDGMGTFILWLAQCRYIPVKSARQWKL